MSRRNYDRAEMTEIVIIFESLLFSKIAWSSNKIYGVVYFYNWYTFAIQPVGCIVDSK